MSNPTVILETPVVSTRPVGRRRRPLLWLILRRLGIMLVLCLALSILVFVGTQVLPGDAARAILGRNATPQALQALREQLGLDQPLVNQYLSWISGAVRGNFGTSIAAQRDVADYLLPSIRNTAVLAVTALVVLIPLSIVLGVVAGVRRDGWIDHVVTATSLTAISLPEFVVGALLVYFFAVRLDLLPAVSFVPPDSSPLSDPAILVLPAATLVIAGLGYTARIVRASIAEVMESEYVIAAKLNGYSNRSVVWRHALPNALAPTIQTMTLTAAWVVGGTVVVETVFGYPGLGQALAQAVQARDIPTVQAATLVIGVTYVVLNLSADVLTVLLIPRLRTSL